jgi:hypothetical protein
MRSRLATARLDGAGGRWFIAVMNPAATDAIVGRGSRNWLVHQTALPQSG